MIRMLTVGDCMGIERRLCEEVHLNLAYRWFCRLGLDGRVPNHSTFSKNRHGRFRESDLLRHMFESVVQRCMAEGLVGADDLRSTQALSPPTPTSSARFQARTGSLKRSRRTRFAPHANISLRLTTRRSARPPLSRRSSSPDLIRQPSGRAHIRGMLSSPTPPTSRRRGPFGRPRSERRGQCSREPRRASA